MLSAETSFNAATAAKRLSAPAVHPRLILEPSSHYAAYYPTVMQYVVATPSIRSRHDVCTCGIIKLLVQMQVLLPHARLIIRPCGGRSVIHADVVALKRYLRDHHHLYLWNHHDAAILTARSTSQHRSQPNKNKANPNDGTTNAAMHAGPACPSGKSGSRQRKGPRDGSAVQPTAKFPPPPSRSGFRSTPLSANYCNESTRTTGPTSLVDPAQTQNRKPRSRSRPAPLAVKESVKTNSRGKKKEHPFRDEVQNRSKDKQAPAAQADTLKQSVKRKPGKVQPDPLSVMGQTEAETAQHQGPDRRPRTCAFCDHSHGAAKCIFYRSRTQRVRRARELGYCFICLRVGHMLPACPSRTPSPCHLCKPGQLHRALCPLASSNTGSGKQTALRRSPPSWPASAPGPATTTLTPATKIAKKGRKQDRVGHSTDAPPAAQMPPTSEPAEAHHRRKSRKRKNREPKK